MEPARGGIYPVMTRIVTWKLFVTYYMWYEKHFETYNILGY
jgi:hypothetical protein